MEIFEWIQTHWISHLVKSRKYLQSTQRGMISAKSGDVVGPIQLTGPRMENSWGVARIIEMKKGGITEFEDVREMIEGRLRQIRSSEDLIEDLRTRTFVDIRLVPKETP